MIDRTIEGNVLDDSQDFLIERNIYPHSLLDPQDQDPNSESDASSYETDSIGYSDREEFALNDVDDEGDTESESHFDIKDLEHWTEGDSEAEDDKSGARDDKSGAKENKSEAKDKSGAEDNHYRAEEDDDVETEEDGGDDEAEEDDDDDEAEEDDDDDEAEEDDDEEAENDNGEAEDDNGEAENEDDEADDDDEAEEDDADEDDDANEDDDDEVEEEEEDDDDENTKKQMQETTDGPRHLVFDENSSYTPQLPGLPKDDVEESMESDDDSDAAPDEGSLRSNHTLSQVHSKLQEHNKLQEQKNMKKKLQKEKRTQIHERNKLQKLQKIEKLEKKNLTDQSRLPETLLSKVDLQKLKRHQDDLPQAKRTKFEDDDDVQSDIEVDNEEEDILPLTKGVIIKSISSESEKGKSLASKALDFRNRALYGNRQSRTTSWSQRQTREKQRAGGRI